MLLFVLAWLTPGRAAAFHVGSTFQDPPGAGGAGRIYYLGTPLERGWDCTMCHTEPPGRIRVQLEVQPPELFESFAYQPGASYTFTVRMFGEHRGLGAGLSNFNGLVLAFTDAQGIYVGSLGGFDPNVFFNGGGVIASSGTQVGETSWTFTWTAPMEEVGPATLYLGVVDGNGADSAPTETRTDPFHDDVFMATVRLARGGATAGASPPSDEAHRATGRGRLALARIPAPRPPAARPAAESRAVPRVALGSLFVLVLWLALARARHRLEP